jgi:hypothetical protein
MPSGTPSILGLLNLYTMKIIYAVQAVKDFAAQLKDQVAQLFPSPMTAVDIVAADIDLTGIEPDDYGRFDIVVEGVLFRPTLAKGQDKSVLKGKCDIVKYSALSPAKENGKVMDYAFKIQGKEFPIGYSAPKLVKAGSFKPAGSKASKRKEEPVAA